MEPNNSVEKLSLDGDNLDPEECHLLSEGLASRYPHHRRISNKLLFYGGTIIASLLVLNMIFMGGVLVVYRRFPRNCFEKFNAFSPFQDAVDEDDTQEVRFKYSLYYKSPYKGPPTPEVHAAWFDLMDNGVMSATEDDIRRMGHNATEAVRFPSNIGNGGYPVFSSGTHAIHCLHHIWKDHYIDELEEVQDLKKNHPTMYELHYNHCVDYMRQYIMCKWDATAVPFNWVLDHQNPTPNGDTIHKCVNWNSMQAWMKRHAVVEPEGFVWRQPEDAIRLDRNPGALSD